ncbi:MAG: hypothetical protein K0R09_176 [Clostridiales bacterium]|jgi:hypothetical protein|nr:hypothetical protein [Clostridiales bacterium]
MIGIREKAEVYKLGLLIGYFKLEEIFHWIDKTIENEEKPDIGIIEIAYSTNRNRNDVISLINNINGEFSSKVPVRILLGLMYKDFLGGRIVLEDMTSKLYSLSQYLTKINLEEHIIRELNTINDYHHFYSDDQIKQKLEELLKSITENYAYLWLE